MNILDSWFWMVSLLNGFSNNIFSMDGTRHFIVFISQYRLAYIVCSTPTWRTMKIVPAQANASIPSHPSNCFWSGFKFYACCCCSLVSVTTHSLIRFSYRFHHSPLSLHNHQWKSFFFFLLFLSFVKKNLHLKFYERIILIRNTTSFRVEIQQQKLRKQILELKNKISSNTFRRIHRLGQTQMHNITFFGFQNVFFATSKIFQM